MTQEEIFAETDAYFQGLSKVYFFDDLKMLEKSEVKCNELERDLLMNKNESSQNCVFSRILYSLTQPGK